MNLQSQIEVLESWFGYPIEDLDDLNVLHEMEKMLPDHLWYDYETVLHWKIKEDTDLTDGPERTWHATASQRREALLRVLNLWKT